MDGVPTSISKLTTPTPSVKRQDTWKIYVGIIVGSVLLLLTIPLVSTLRRKWIEKRKIKEQRDIKKKIKECDKEMEFIRSYGTSSPSMPLVRQSRLGSRSSAYSAAISMGSHGTIPGYSFGQTAERIEPRQNFEEINCYLDSMDPRSELLFMRNSRSYHSMPKGQYLSINGVRNSAPCLLPDYIERYGNFGSEEPYGQSRDRMDRLRSYNDMNLYWPEDESQMNRQCHRMSLDLSPALDKNLIAHDEYDIQSDLQQNHQHTLDYEGSFQQPYVERRSSVNSLQDTTEYGSEDNLIMEVKVHHPAERKNSEVEMLSQDYLHGKI